MYRHNRVEKQKAYESSVKSAVSGNVHPVLAYMKITRECNLECGYCVERNMLVNNDMGFEEWKRTSDIIYGLGNRSISIVGGDPLLVPYVSELIEYMSARDAFVSMSTNGICLTEDILHTLDKAGLDSLGISIDTFPIEGQPKFGKELTPGLVNILKIISKSNFRFSTGIASVVTRYNLPILPEMLRYFTELGIPIRFSLMVRGVLNHKYAEHLALGESDLDNVRQIFSKLYSMKSEGYLFSNDTSDRLEVRMGVRTPVKVYQMYMGEEEPHFCRGGIYDLPVDNDGRLGTCCTGLTSTTHIFDLKSLQDYQGYIDRNMKITEQCGGCPWSHKWVLTHLAETGGLMKNKQYSQAKNQAA
jgi:MoaA/NifB/PqqE/SkfB family radical SAM enzyme